ncbi:hypothetical protein [Paracoccus sp. (in: a-proteobacteria)]|uniref:hypothetical protein n=1 Tax=Paracoccus sp. TaxID=267 RepID=UPI0028A8B19E|nr:hypothetical protein [Paracoccus sp. (in: a-proteobacteria)]
MLTAPAHLRGRMPESIHDPLRIERNAWIAARAAEGHTRRAIGDALGVTHQTVSSVLCRRGLKSKRGPARPTQWVTSAGIQLGSVGPAFVRMPDAAQNHIANIAAKTGCTIADAMAQCVTDAMEGRIPGTGGGKSGSAGGCGRNERDGGSVSQEIGSLT